ncbi:MAG: hypothetical protein H8K04_02695 [Nitrospira sp.]
MIKPVGKIGEPLVFYFYEAANSSTSMRLNIVDFVVQEQKSDDKWDTIWQLNGEQSVEAITYGGRYKGLAETTSPKPLSLQGNYRVIAKDRPRFDPPGYSAVFFRFNEEGFLIVTSPH